MPARIPGRDARPDSRQRELPLGIREIALLLNVKRPTVDKWRERGVLPPPDGEISGAPVWWPDTILRWARATGRLW